MSLALYDDGNPNLRLLRHPRRPLTEKQWASAFDEFLAIHCLKFPNDLIPLLSYGKYIKTLMQTGYNWSLYDREFRRIREESLCEWDHIHLDLQLIATKTPMKSEPSAYDSRSSLRPSFSTSNINRSPTCFLYNSEGKRCFRSNCSYRHACSSCSNRHPVYFCRKLQNQNSQKPKDSAPQSSTSSKAQ